MQSATNCIFEDRCPVVIQATFGFLSGAQTVAQICGELCLAGKNQDGELCTKLFAQLNEELVAFTEHMKTFLNIVHD